MSTFWESFKIWCFRYLPAILAVSGVILYLFGYFYELTLNNEPAIGLKIRESIPGIVKGIAIAALSSGIFAAILKSIQFSGIFKEEIAKVIYSHEYMSKMDRKALELVWHKVTEVLLNRRFPEIDKQISSIVLEKYLSSNHSYYYKDFQIIFDGLQIINENSKDYVQYKQIVELKLIPFENGQFEWRNSYEFPSDNNSYRRLIELKVKKASGGDPVDYSENPVTNGEIKLELNGSKWYHIRKVEERKIPLNGNECELFATSRVTENLQLDINYNCNNTRIEFVKLGTTEEFETLYSEPKKGILKKKYEGLILPFQGYCLFLTKVN